MSFNAVITALNKAARIVPREMTGVVAASSRDFNDIPAGLNQTVKVPVVPKATVGDNIPAAYWPTGDTVTPATRDLTLTQSKEISWHMTAEDELALMSSGTYNDTLNQMFEQGVREMVNHIETYTAAAAYTLASRAFGTAGTTPFASDLTMAAKVKKELDKNGAPAGNRSIILGGDAEENVLNQLAAGFLQGANDRKNVEQGVILNLHGSAFRKSEFIADHVKGTGTSYLVNNGSGIAVGGETIAVDGGSGTIKAGDIITHAEDSTNKYVVNSALSGGEIGIGAPGLLVAASDDAALTVGNNFTANLAMHKSALQVVVRPALNPKDSPVFQRVITDKESGLSFLFVRVGQKGQVSWFLQSVFDVFAPNKEFLHIILG